MLQSTLEGYPVESDGRRRRYFIPCPKCGESRWLKAHDARTALANARICFLCSQAAKAPLGWKAAISKPGARDKVLAGWQAYRNKNQSSLETAVEGALQALDVWLYARNVPMKTRRYSYLVDFTFSINGQQYALEINGNYWHSQPGRERTWKRKRALLKRRGFEVILIEEHQFGRARQIIARALGLRETAYAIA